jgi:endonuclease YncB( thermonuclease family)
MPLTPTIVCEAPRVIDGDTIRCAGLGKVRLHALNAREHDGTCRGHAPCPAASAAAATRRLAQLLRVTPVRLEPVDVDRYGRLVAHVRAGANDVGCQLVREGLAAPWPRYGDPCPR